MLRLAVHSPPIVLADCLRRAVLAAATLRGTV